MRNSVILFLFTVCSLGYLPSLGQVAAISGKVTGEGSGLPAATVSLLKGTDSSWIRSVLTNDEGVFSFGGITIGDYIISASSVGYETGIRLLALKDTNAPQLDIDLRRQSASLAEVSVTAGWPLIEMSLGKVTVNIEGSSTTATSNALDLMRRLPGVTVDQNGNISMQGREGVLVLIDDRQTYLSGYDLADYLRTISAEEISRMELITQPGARYDASGNTGVINIKLKKNKKQGWNGNIMLSYGNAIYFHREESFLLNYRKNKLCLSLSSLDMEAIGFADWKETLYFTDAQTGNAVSKGTIHSTPKERFGNNVVRLSADYNWTEKTTVGVNVRSTYHPNIMPGHLFSTTSDLVNNSVTSNDIVTREGFIRKDIMANACLTGKFNKQSTLDINLDCLAYTKKAYEDYSNTTYNDLMQPQSNPEIFNMREPSSIDVYSAKADHVYTFKNEIRLESGLKSSWVNTSDNVDFKLYENNNWIIDTLKTNHFLYKENINAGYITLSGNIGKKWDAKIGLRVEQTNAEGVQSIHNDLFRRDYFSAFPTAYLNYKRDTNNTFEWNYGRRINRPSYKWLNPSVFYSFQNNYSLGNPYLRPEYANNMELKHSYRNMIITTLSYSGTSDVIQDMLEVRDTAKVVYNVFKNIATDNAVSLSVLFNKDLFKWWSINIGGNVFDAVYEGVLNNRKVRAEWSGYAAHMNTQIDFGKGWKSDAYISYISAGKVTIIESFDPNIYMEFGVSKKINSHFLVKFSANDPFNAYRIGIHDADVNFHADSRYRHASQLYTFSATFNFGGNQARKEKATSLDEASRVN